MSPLLEKVLAEAAQLDPKEQLQLVSYLVNRWQEPPTLLADTKFSRKNLFGCMRGKIKIAADFNAPLHDFAEYMLTLLSEDSLFKQYDVETFW